MDNTTTNVQGREINLLDKAKQEIAKKYGLKKMPFPNFPIAKMCDEVAELYSRYKLAKYNIIENSVCAKCGGSGYYNLGYSTPTKVKCDCNTTEGLVVSEGLATYGDDGIITHDPNNPAV